MILYVSWGGTGRVASVYEAMRRAAEVTGEEHRGLRYLAVLDDDHFADLDESLLAVVTDELAWLLQAQLTLTCRQLDVPNLPVEVVVRRGDVLDAVVDVLDEHHDAEVLIGAPVPERNGSSLDDLLHELRGRLGSTPVSVLDPDPA